MLKQIKFLAGVYAANSYILYDDQTKDSVIIDCGGDHDVIIDFLDKNNLTLKAILLTHGHADHIAGVIPLKKALNVDVYIHENDNELLNDSNKNLSANMAMSEISFDSDYTFKDKDILNFDSIKIEVLSTPGHTKGSVCFKTDIGIFSGDTLFKGSIGRSDLYGGNESQILNSLNTLLNSLENETEVYPGHGPKTTIGYEKEHNMFVK